MGLGRRRKLRRADISAPFSFRHLTHVELDARTGGYVGLPKQWTCLMHEVAPQSPRPKPLVSMDGRTCSYPGRFIVGASSSISRASGSTANVHYRSESPIRSPAAPRAAATDGRLSPKVRPHCSIESVKSALRSIVDEHDPRNNLHEIGRLGDGSSSVVFQAYNTKMRKTIAVKRMAIDKQAIPELLLNEVAVMKSCDHPHIVQFFSSHLVDNELWICMELAGGGLLTDYVCKKRLLEESIATISKQCLEALHYLHSRRIIHRDIKSDSVLVMVNRTVKLFDFGFAAVLTDQWPKRRSLLCTPFWSAPEVLLHEFYGTEIDIWSFAITVVEMIQGEPFYFEHDAHAAIELIKSQPPARIPDTVAISAELRSFLDSMLVRAPADRATADQLLRHAFLRKALHDPTLVIL
ncbi:Non-specific serine/threonine protein kinase [Aphelenchoides fujianensis]|nr:Non-specific serine/threonine protein kinase [Aphelenchoides fujianensis]